jgi:hypothetical protein
MTDTLIDTVHDAAKRTEAVIGCIDTPTGVSAPHRAPR